jgi:anti-sigma-K factor RskA
MSEQDITAAEFALGLLEGQALLDARGRLASDAAFAEEVAWWETRFAPLFDRMAPVEPPANGWERVEASIASASNDNVRRLTTRLRVWRSIAAATTAAAVAAGAALVLVPRLEAPAERPAEAAAPAQLLVASLSSEEGPTSLSVTYVGSERSLVVAPGRVSQVDRRDHELWVIPAGAAPISLGTIDPSGVQRRQISPAVAATIASGATIALSLEPAGGSPTGQPTGAVLAAGTLNPA